MAKEVIEKIYCDICGETAEVSKSYLYDRRMDAAGSMENCWYDVDLCAMHYDELTRMAGPDTVSIRRQRGLAMAYGSRVKQWVEQQASIWKQMLEDEKRLWMDIESLR